MVAAGATMSLLAFAAIAISDSNARTELVYRSSLDSTINPASGTGNGGFALGDGSLEESYVGENVDAPGIPASYEWATSMEYDPSTGETGVQEGHAPDWILPLGSASGPLKGPKSHYYNEWAWDSDPSTGGDFAAGDKVPVEDIVGENFVDNEQSNPDHSTSEPYTSGVTSSAIGVIDGGIGTEGTGGKSSVENILNFDSWLMNSNGIY